VAISLDFRLDSAVPLNYSSSGVLTTIRVRYTDTPKTVSGSNSVRADYAPNYTITGPSGPVTVSSVSPTAQDLETIDVFAFLAPGSYTLTVAGTVTSISGIALTASGAPLTVSFAISAVKEGPIPGGATNAASADTLRSFLNPAYRNRPTWEAIIAGLATGDASVKAMAQSAFDQLFLTSASGSYLTKRASDYGIARPANIGISDQDFRKLAIATVSSKLTSSAVADILEVLCGTETVRAYADAAVNEPMTLNDGTTLSILVDELHLVNVTLNRTDFAIIRRALVDEVAAVINRAFEDAGANAYATSTQDTTTGVKKLRVYSGSRGLVSAIRITGGTAQPDIQFPSALSTISTAAPPATTWTITLLGNNTARLSSSSSFSYPLGSTVVGDYVVIRGSEFSAVNQGSFPIVNVFVGPSSQYIDITNPKAAPQTVSQLAYRSLVLFHPLKSTIYQNPSYSLFTQAGGQAIVNVAATSTSVHRSEGSGAYVHNPQEVLISNIVRNPDGTTTVTTSGNHGIQIGSSFVIDSVATDSFVAPSSSGAVDPGVYGGTNTAFGTSYLSANTLWTSFSPIRYIPNQLVADQDKDVWITGNYIVGGAGNTIAWLTPINQISNTNGTKQTSYRTQQGALLDFSCTSGSAPIVYSSNASNNNSLYLIGGYSQLWNNLTATAVTTVTPLIVTKRPPLRTVLHANQLNNTQGILAAIPLWFLANPVSGDVLSISTGGTTRTYGFGTGGNVTVTIGGTAAITMSNLATAITGDGAAAWTAVNTTTLVNWVATSAVVVIEKTSGGGESPLRMWGLGALSAKTNIVAYAPGTSDPTQVKFDYSTVNSFITPLPFGDPLFGIAGFRLPKVSLSTNDIYSIIDNASFSSWQTTVWNNAAMNWLKSVVQDSTSLVTPAADQAVVQLGTKLLVTGGNTTFNLPTNAIQEGPGTWTQPGGSLITPRAGHSMVPLTSTTALVIGGRRPVSFATRTRLGITGWDFDEAFGAAILTGPVSVSVNGNARVPGKSGYGVNLSTSLMQNPAPGAAQTTLNGQLQLSYTLVGWMTNNQGVVFRNGAATFSSLATQTNLMFGVDTNDDKFFLYWMNSGGGILNKSSVTRTSLWGPSISNAFPVYHQFLIEVNAAGGVVYLYLDGKVIISVATSTPDGGLSGIWNFGMAPTASEIATGCPNTARFTGCIDAIGFGPGVQAVDSDIRGMYNEEVGVMYDNPTGVDLSPVGTVLNSCEIVSLSSNLNPTVPAGSMTYARYAFGCVKLPDGRVIVAGGIGYNPSTAPFPSNKSQRQLELNSSEIYDPATKIWTPLPNMADPHSYGLCEYVADENRVYVSGGFTSIRTEYLDVKTLRWHVLPAQMTAGTTEFHYFSRGTLLGGSYPVILGGARNNSGVYDVSGSTNYGFVMVRGGNRIMTGGLNGTHTALSGTGSNILVFKDSTHLAFTSVTGSGVVTPLDAVNEDDLKGPFMFDPKMGITVSSSLTTLTSRREKGGSYTFLDVASTANIPSTPGFLVLQFGHGNQIGPLPYQRTIGTNQIAIDGRYAFPATVEIGSSVSVVKSSEAVPENIDSLGAFYATAATAGRQAAQNLISDIAPAGIETALTVRYPGDRGLGGEGFPATGSSKISDQVYVWGGDTVDAEIKKAKGE